MTPGIPLLEYWIVSFVSIRLNRLPKNYVWSEAAGLEYENRIDDRRSPTHTFILQEKSGENVT